MATIQLHDERDPMEAGDAIYTDLLEGRHVTGDRAALAWALDAAARDLGGWWQHLAGRMLEAVAQPTDSTVCAEVLDARQDVARVTEISYGLLATLSDSVPGIVEAQQREDPRHGA